MKNLIEWCEELLDDDTVELTPAARTQLRLLLAAARKELRTD